MSCHDQQQRLDILKKLAQHHEEYEQLESEEVLTWCTGCGNFGIQNALKRALVLEGYGMQDVLHCFDVGCNGNGSDKIHGYTFHGLHGRVLPVASGAALANPKMKIIASAGDGATFSEGVNHLIHAVRNNYPVLFLMHNNENYGLTTGQASSTTRPGQKMNASPDGITADPMNPLELVLGLNPSFVARSFSGDVEHMTEMIRQGLRHNGFACIEIMQICTTYNKATSHEWFWDRLKYLDQQPNYDKRDIWQARKAVEDITNQINVGVFFENRDSLPFPDRLPNRKGIKTTPIEEVKHYDISKLMSQFA